MTVASPTESAARAVQKDIDKLQEELHGSACKIMSAANLKKNAHFAARHAVLQNAIKSGQLARTFWADAIITIFSAFSATPPGETTTGKGKKETKEEDDDDEDGLLGPFDAFLLREYLEDMQVAYTAGGTRVTLTFKPNPFFEETQLWAEMLQELSEKEEKGEEGEGENTADGCRFSDITWKPGHGPTDDDDDDENENDDAKNNNENAKNNKSGHSGVKHGRDDPKDGETRGWSILEKFSVMPPHPDDEFNEENNNNNDDEEDEDDEELEMAVQQWEAEIEERKEFLQVLVEDVWANPLLATAAAQQAAKEEENNNNNNSAAPEKHRVRTE